MDKVGYHILCSITVKPVLNYDFEIDKTKVLITIGSLMKVESIESIQGEHSAIFLTFIKLLFVFKFFILSIFE